MHSVEQWFPTWGPRKAVGGPQDVILSMGGGPQNAYMEQGFIQQRAIRLKAYESGYVCV